LTDDRRAKLLGPWMTLALVVGSVIGSGIFFLPITLAPLGPSMPFGWLVSGVGAMALAYCASTIVSPDGGGLQAYIEHELGPYAGFVIQWATWCSTWAAMPAIALATASALTIIAPQISGYVVAISAAQIVVLTAVNLHGVRSVGGVAIVTTAIKILPLIAVAAIAMVLATTGGPLHPLEGPPVSLDNIATATALCLFALTGFELAMSPVGKIRDPERNLSRAVLLGVGGVAAAYLVATVALDAVLPAASIAGSDAPFAQAIGTYWGTAAGTLAAIAMAVSAFGALNGGILAAGEMLYSLALRADVPVIFARTNRHNAPYVAQLFGGAGALILLGLNASKDTASLFTFIILLATDAVLFLYAAAAVAAVRKRPRPMTIAAALIGLCFVAFAFYGSGLEAAILAFVLLGTGPVLRAVLNFARRRGSTPAAEAS